jgi:hypothetical protein
MNDKTLHRKLKIEQQEVIPLKTRGYPCCLYEYSYNIDILQNYIIPCVCLSKNFIYPPLLGLWLWADEIPEMPIYESFYSKFKKEWMMREKTLLLVDILVPYWICNQIMIALLYDGPNRKNGIFERSQRIFTLRSNTLDKWWDYYIRHRINVWTNYIGYFFWMIAEKQNKKYIKFSVASRVWNTYQVRTMPKDCIAK